MRPFKRSLPMTLTKAREAVVQGFLPHLRDRDLSPQQWRVLRVLIEVDSMEIKEIARHCGLLLPSLSRIIRNLERRGLVTRQAVESDLRRSCLTITDSGRELFESVAPYSEQNYERITRLYGRERLEQLYGMLDELIEVLGGDKPGGSG